MPLENIPILTCSSAIQNINITVSRRAYDGENLILDNDIENSEFDKVIDGNVEVFSKLLNREIIKKY